ncbi:MULTISPECIES: YheC/YheD family protein [Bacillus amyloliquefaciens group]|uniref:YheC/YheD family endospore coat-associated protein n=1 Tax=Bacillus amyloliquefaciens group TaxID=1938374 RepID=UPI001363556E|nr:MULTISPECIES: YheC/YheD family protein [Bacillus amyloliquefaciens group]MBO3649698.1 YheC/YheD family protein [Bacillus amyloliquefaciens]MCJ2175846.1 YheC/YheD family protein [Bacillus amyloliquefaciens]MCR4349465.1 YheC/YheD family protein [Bacillus amyloliquefaciens]MCR4357953.1 YheC/YheD family protein [Bacillus amyloliquefaciens]MEC1481829.1 YheC/YheD family protein [Bacillus velezensis]
MTTLGFMSVSRRHEEDYAGELAERAPQYNVRLARFTPFDIFPDSLRVKALVYHPQSGKWNETEIDIPEYIYDRCFYGKSAEAQKAKPIVEWLKKYPKTEFIGRGLPDKWTVTDVLQKHHLISPYIPETAEVSRYEQVQSYLAKEKACILKPAFGAGGRGIILLETGKKSITATYYIGKNKQTKSFSNHVSFKSWCKKVLQHRYLLQSYLNIQDKERHPCDIRIFMRKTESGVWETVGKAVRRGYQNGLLSHLSGGSEPIKFDTWFEEIPRKQQAVLLDDVFSITQSVPYFLDERFGPLFELGLDICYAKDGRIWLLDVNSKPGRKAILSVAPEAKEDLYTSPLRRFRELQSQESRKGVLPRES